MSGFLVLLFLVFFLGASRVEASPTSTIRGAAWWGDEIGFLYFNCADNVSGDQLDITGNLTPPGFKFFAPPCLYNNHGVFIAPNGNLYGEAWNYSKSFVSFAGTSSPPTADPDPRVNCPDTCNDGNDCWSCYKESEKKLYGWARVNTTGEWIRLDSAFPPDQEKPPVQLENGAAEPIILSKYEPPTAAELIPGDFFGIASSSLGDLFFHCRNESDSGACSLRGNYKVYIGTLAIGLLTAPNFSYAQACSGSGLGATLTWSLKSGQQTAYEIVVNKDSDFGPEPTPEQISSATCYSGKKSSNFSNQYILPNYDSNCGSLEYNKNYYWWVRLYNELDEPTIWYQYYGNSASDTDGDRDNNPKTFSTFKHHFPSPYFDWPDGDIFIGTSTEFTSDADDNYSVYYDVNQPSTPKRCTSLACSYFWWSSDPYAEFSSTSTATTSISFWTATNTTVSLRITDESLYYCTRTSAIKKINYDLPIWREVKAR